MAAARGHFDCLKVLVDAGADVATQDYVSESGNMMVSARAFLIIPVCNVYNICPHSIICALFRLRLGGLRPWWPLGGGTPTVFSC